MDYPLKTADQLRPHLRALRRKRGLTQAQLGEAIGVTQARVVEIEAQPGVVSLQQILQVLQALGAGVVIRETAGGPTVHVAQEGPSTEPQDAPKAKKGTW
jgi:HTH-type transcriptional regulator/antitoxin HipB